MNSQNQNEELTEEDKKINELSQKIQEQKKDLVELEDIVSQLKDEILKHNKDRTFSVYLPHFFVFCCIIALIAKSFKTIL